MSLGTIFALLVAYQVKHFVADYPLQGKFMLGKFKDGWDFLLPLLAHVGVHAAGTALICLAMGKLELALPLALLDATIHFCMDRIKAGKKYLGRFKALSALEWVHLHSNPLLTKEEIKRAERGNTFFWWALGFDQMVHHLTHYICIYLLLTH